MPHAAPGSSEPHRLACMLYVPKASPSTMCRRCTRSSQRTASPYSSRPMRRIRRHARPLLLEAGGRLGTLTGHLARGNRTASAWRARRSWPSSTARTPTSPSLYATHPSVPTWNFTAVHAHRGAARLVRKAPALEAIVRPMVGHYEGGRPQPWQMQCPDDYREQMLRGIVGFHIEITSLTGKFKLSQNRPHADRARVREAFASGTARAGAGPPHARRDRPIIPAVSSDAGTPMANPDVYRARREQLRAAWAAGHGRVHRPRAAAQPRCALPVPLRQLFPT